MLNAALLPLHTDRAVLRTMLVADAAAYASGTHDEAVREYAHLPDTEYTKDSVVELIRGPICEGVERGDLAVLTIAEPVSDAFCGSLVLFGVKDRVAEVGFWIHPDHRGKSLAGAALTLATDFAQRSGLTLLTARTVPQNRASQRVLESAGFMRGAQTIDTAPSGKDVVLLHYSRQIGPIA